MEKQGFTRSKVWEETRFLFFVGRIFGISYLTGESDAKLSCLNWLLKLNCGFIGFVLVGNISIVATNFGEAPLLSGTVEIEKYAPMLQFFTQLFRYIRFLCL